MSAVLAPLEVYRAPGDGKRGLAVGRAFALNEDLSDEVDATLTGAGGKAVAGSEEDQWRADAKASAKAPQTSLRNAGPDLALPGGGGPASAASGPRQKTPKLDRGLRETV